MIVQLALSESCIELDLAKGPLPELESRPKEHRKTLADYMFDEDELERVRA